jgi:hypothetical protein
MIAPVVATRDELAGIVAPTTVRTEAYTWPLTGLVAGAALGAATSGSLADATSWQAPSARSGSGARGSRVDRAPRDAHFGGPSLAVPTRAIAVDQGVCRGDSLMKGVG